MAYLDSQKNRAMWEIRLEGLRKQRADREAGKIPEQKQPEAAAEIQPHRRRITYEELLQREAQTMKRGGPEQNHSMNRQMDRQPSRQPEAKSL